MLGFVIGDQNMVTGFKLAGVEGLEVTSAEQASQALAKALKRSDVALIVVSEEFSGDLRKQIDEARRNPLASLIVEVPGRFGSSGEVTMSDLVSKTLGVRI
jgi:V/A-type H+/Na+-transporting ATPase subunit F